MKLTVFQSDKGDCMLLTGADGRRVLVDGGMRAAYAEHVAPALGRLREQNEVLNVVCLSHIDQDHIAGVLQMMDDEVDWRVHDYQVRHGNPGHKQPGAPRPPVVKAIWHNAFHDQVDKNAGAIEEMLAASAAILSGSSNPAARALASAENELVTSIAESFKLTLRVGPRQLGIKLNPPARGKLMLVRPAASAIRVGGMRFRIIGPFASDLRKLREEWNTWLGENKAQLRTIRSRAGEQQAGFGTCELDEILLPKLAQAGLLSDLLPLDEIAASSKLGDRAKVTTPNLASLMFYVEEKGRTLLLTGDGHHAEILHGLRSIGKMKGNQGIHVNILKVQHHGSEHNIDEAFCRAVTADHYVFCGNGEHGNPNLRVIRAIADSRLGSGAQLSANPQAALPFKFWFNSNSAAPKAVAARDHMQAVGSLVAGLAAASAGRMGFTFLKGSSFEIQA